MNNRNLFEISAKLLVAWLLLSLLGIFTGRHLTITLLPLFSEIIDAISSSYVYSHILKVISANNVDVIQIVATLQKPIPLNKDFVIPAGKSMSASIQVAHLLVPIVILFIVLIVWPVKNLQQRALLVLLGVPMSILVLAFTVSPLLAAHIELQLATIILDLGGKPNEPIVLDWMVFIESGGRWLLPIAGGLICVSIAKSIENYKSAFIQTEQIKRTTSANAQKKSKKEKKQEKKAKIKKQSTDMVSKPSDVHP